MGTLGRFENPDDDEVRSLLERARRIVVVGLSPKPHRDSHSLARYLLARGYEVDHARLPGRAWTRP